MKVAELEGALLDYWVARAQEVDGVFVRGKYCFYRSRGADFIYSPSVDWAQGGPISERRGITATNNVAIGRWKWHATETFSPYLENDWIGGDTQLIAAMRAVVRDEFGDEVPEMDAQPGSAG
ncbi:MAG: phage protein NinX family protein [Pseudomonadota bacterium]